MSEKMKEFLDKVDFLCNEYGYQIQPTLHNKYQQKTITIFGNGELIELLFIDGDGIVENF